MNQHHASAGARAAAEAFYPRQTFADGAAERTLESGRALDQLRDPCRYGDIRHGSIGISIMFKHNGGAICAAVEDAYRGTASA